MLLSHLKIAYRLLLGFGVLMLLIAGLCGFLVYTGRSADASVTELLRLKGDEVLDQSVGTSVYKARYALWRYMATGDHAHVDTMQAAFRAAHDKLSDLAANVRSPERRARLVELTRAIETYGQAVVGLTEIRGRNPNLDSEAAQRVVADAKAKGDAIDGIAQDLDQSFKQSADHQAAATTAGISWSITISMVIGLASLLAGGILSLAIRRSIVRPVNEIARNVQQAATGTQEVASNIDGVRQAAGETGSAASQVMTASRSLSRETTRLKDTVDTFLADVRAA